jgi:hypothetical protein
LAHVPDVARAEFRSLFGLALHFQWKEDRLLPDLLNAGVQPTLIKLGRAAAEFKDLLQTCVTTRDTSFILTDILNAVHGQTAATPHPNLRHYAALASPLIEAAQMAGYIAKVVHAAKGPKRRGRPSRKSNITLWKVTNILLRVVDEVGGHLTFTSANGGRGTLIAALEMLRPFLPDRAIPTVLPIGSLDRILTTYRKRVRQHQKTRNKRIF